MNMNMNTKYYQHQKISSLIINKKNLPSSSSSSSSSSYNNNNNNNNKYNNNYNTSSHSHSHSIPQPDYSLQSSYPYSHYHDVSNSKSVHFSRCYPSLSHSCSVILLSLLLFSCNLFNLNSGIHFAQAQTIVCSPPSTDINSASNLFCATGLSAGSGQIILTIYSSLSGWAGIGIGAADMNGADVVVGYKNSAGQVMTNAYISQSYGLTANNQCKPTIPILKPSCCILYFVFCVLYFVLYIYIPYANDIYI